MSDTVTIPRQTYEKLRRQADAWRSATGTGTVIFNAVRDNGGKAMPVKNLIRTLRKLERE